MPRRSRAYRLVTVAAALAIAPALPLALGARAAPSGQADSSRERGIYVSVVTRDGSPVTNLSDRDFVVREDGVRREVLMAEKASDPLTMAVIVDNSQAAAPFVPDMRRALKAFIAQMAGRSRNVVAVTTSGDRPTILQDYTLVVPQLERAVDRIFPQPNSGSYLLQALQLVSTGFGKRDFQRGVILAITTEGPEFSDLHYQQVVEPLRASGASLNVLVISPSAAAAASADIDETRDRDQALEAGTRETGGRRVILLSSMALDSALKRLGDQLTNEYRLTYARPETLIPPRTIEVSVKRPGLDARGTPIKSTRG